MAESKLDAILNTARTWQAATDDWRAWHVFVDGPESFDRLLAEGVLPEVNVLGGAVDTFFLRYWENGPHIRFRIRGLDDATFLMVGERLRARATEFSGDGPSMVKGSSESARFTNWHGDPGASPRFSPGTTVEVLYEPEFRRYGGRHGLSVNEHLFGASSRLALAIIEKTMGEAPRRQSIALGLTATAISCLISDREGLVTFLEVMKTHWSGFIPDAQATELRAHSAYASAPEAASALLTQVVDRQHAERQPVVMERWRGMVVEHFDALRGLAADGLLIHPMTGIIPDGVAEIEVALQNIMLSQIHMMNNRLGMAPQQEFFFASYLLKALGKT